MPGVLVNMTGQITLKEAMEHFGVSEKTIRRWIKQGKLMGEKRDGRWQLFVTGHDDRTPRQNDHPSGRTLPLERMIEEKDARIEQLQAQLQRKDEQIDHLQQLLAVAQKNLATIAEQNQLLLEDIRPRAWWKRLFRR